MEWRIQAPAFEASCQAVAVYCSSATNGPSVLLTLREDVAGQAAPTTLAAATFSPAAGAWSNVPLPGSVTLQPNASYYIQLSLDRKRGGSHPVDAADVTRSAAFLSSWALYGNGWPIQGQPYTHEAVASIHGNGSPADPADDLLQGQVLHFLCASPLRGLRVRVRKVGSPKLPLKARLCAHDYAAHKIETLAEVVLAQPSQVTPQWSWVEAAIPEIYVGDACYYLVLASAAGAADGQGGCTDCYQLSGEASAPGLPQASLLTFGGGAHYSRASSSSDGGKTWVDAFESDAHVVALTGACTSDGRAPASNALVSDRQAALLQARERLKLQMDQGALLEALPQTEHVMELAQAALGDAHPGGAQLYMDRATVLSGLGRYAQAEADTEWALALLAHGGSEVAATRRAECLAQAARLAVAAGHLNKATERARQALELLPAQADNTLRFNALEAAALAGLDPAENFSAALALDASKPAQKAAITLEWAAFEAKRGDLAKAESLLLEQLKLTNPKDADLTAACREQLATVLEQRGQAAEAKSLLAKALPPREKVAKGLVHFGSLPQLDAAAKLYARLGRQAEAQHVWRLILEFERHRLGAQHPRVVAIEAEIKALTPAK